jgi:hypothetical protein
MLASSSAHAYCRYTTSTPAAWDPVSQGGCYAGDPGSANFVLFWAGLCVGYSLQQDASQYVSLDDATAVAAQAFAAWSAASCSAGGTPSIQAVNNGPVACSNVQYNNYQPNQNVIVFRDNGWPSDLDHDPSNLALTTVQFYINNADSTDLQNGQILGADMEINESDHRIVVDPSTFDAGATGVDVYPLLLVMTHEAGHFLGLAHSALASAIMYARYHSSSVGALTQDDIEGICATAVPGGLRLTTNAGLIDAGTTCDPTPTNGFQSECGDPDAAALPAGDDEGGAGSSGDTVNAAMPNTGGCSVGASSAPQWSAAAGAAWLLGLGLGVRRRTRFRRSSAAAILGFAVASAGIPSLVARDARGSTSIAVTFEELVQSATGVAVVTPVERRATRENGRIVTYVEARVVSLLAGTLPGEIRVRTLGGAVDRMGEIVEGQASFSTEQPTLVFLQPSKSTPGAFVVVAQAQGQFPVVTGPDAKVRIVARADPGGIVEPSPDRLDRISRLLPAGTTPQLARTLLVERTLEDVKRLVMSSWNRLHSK